MSCIRSGEEQDPKGAVNYDRAGFAGDNAVPMVGGLKTLINDESEEMDKVTEDLMGGKKGPKKTLKKSPPTPGAGLVFGFQTRKLTRNKWFNNKSEKGRK